MSVASAKVEGPRPPELEDVFRAEAAFVWSCLRRMGVHADDLEDLTHDVFVTVHRRLPDYDPARPIRPWLFGIAYRTATRHRARAHHQREVRGELPSTGDGQPGADEELGQRRARRRFDLAVAALELDQRAVFVMHDVDEHSMPEIAEALAIPLNTAYSRLRLARERIKRELSHLRST